MSFSGHCGIDLGTTNSSISILANGHSRVLDIDPDNSFNPKVIPSLIYINPQGNIEIGSKATARYLWDITNIAPKPPHLIFTGRYIKAFGPSGASGVGKPIEVPEIIEIDDSGRGRLLQSLKSVLTSETFKGTSLFGKYYSLEDLLGLLISQVKSRAETILNYPLTSVTLGRPVRYVGNPAKEKLALARMTTIAKQSGFKTIKFEYEPVGAALSFGIDATAKKNILVFDFGGGTLDTCIMQFPQKKVLSVSGRPIGGDLINSHIVKSFLLQYFGKNVVISGKLDLPHFYLDAISLNWYQMTLSKNVKFIQALDNFIFKADDPQPIINLKNLIVNDLGYDFFHSVDATKSDLSFHPVSQFIFDKKIVYIKEVISRKNFEKSISQLVQETSDCLLETLKLANLKANQIDQVLLTGGSSKIPIFQELLKSTFGSEKLYLSDPFTSVASGLSLA